MMLPSVTNRSLFNDLFDGFDDFFMRPVGQYKPVHESKAYGLMKTDIKENEKDFGIDARDINGGLRLCGLRIRGMLELGRRKLGNTQEDA